MKIVDCCTITCLQLDVEEDGYPVRYRRSGPDCWEREYGNCWEGYYHSEEIEKAFQDYLRENQHHAT